MSRDTLSLGAVFCLFFRFPGLGAGGSQCRVLTCLLWTGATPEGCPKHGLRLCHHLDEDCRAPLGSPRRPREGMPQHTGHPLCSPQSREPVPGEDTLASHHEPLTVRGDGLEKRGWSCLHRAVEPALTIVVHATALHGAGVQSDPPIKWVVVGVESPEVFSSFVRDFFLSSAYHGGMLRRRPQALSKHCT